MKKVVHQINVNDDEFKKVKKKRSVKKYRQQDIDKAISMGKNSFLVFVEERKANTKNKKNVGFTLSRLYSVYTNWCIKHSIKDIKSYEEIYEILHNQILKKNI